MPFPPVVIPAPTSGGFLPDVDVDSVPPTGAVRLENLRVDNGIGRSRPGFAAFLNTPNAHRIIDILNLEFGERSVETVRCTRTTSFRADFAANPNVWAQIEQSAGVPVAWTGTDASRFWGVVAPWTAEPKGRLIIGNGVDTTKSWAGGTGFMTSIGGSATPAKYGLVGPDGRLFVAGTTESGTLRAQRVRWTVIGDASDWAGAGSGFLDIRAANWPITALWVMQGRIYVGFSRAIAVLEPTGNPTDAYGSAVLIKDGNGVLGGSIVLYDNLSAFLSGSGFVAFNGTSAPDPIGPHLLPQLRDRLNYGALDQITRYLDEENQRIGWGLPLDGSATPTEVWWFHFRENRWEFDTFAHTALAAVTSTDIKTYDEWAGTTFDARAGISFDNLSSSASLRPLMVTGKADGSTKKRDTTATTDDGMAITSRYVSGGVPVLGLQGEVAGRQHTIAPNDFVVADRVEIDLLDRGANYTIKIDVSGDGGLTWTELGQPSLVSAAPETDRRRESKFVTGRVPVKDRIQVRLTNVTAGAKWGWGRLAVTPDVVGRKR